MRSCRTAALFVLCLFLCACARNARMDYSELGFRLGETDPRFAFSEENLFRVDATWYVYYGFTRENDMLLTFKEDETGLLTSVTLALDGDSVSSAEDFRAFSLALAAVFIPDVDLDALAAGTGLCGADLFSLHCETWSCGFYRAALFCSEGGPVFSLEYGELYEKST